MKTLHLACCAGIGLIGSLAFLHWKDPSHKKYTDVGAVTAKFPQESVASLLKPAAFAHQPLSTSKKTFRSHVRELRTSRTKEGILQPSVIRINDDWAPAKPGTQALISKIADSASLPLAVSTASSFIVASSHNEAITSVADGGRYQRTIVASPRTEAIINGTGTKEKEFLTEGRKVSQAADITAAASPATEVSNAVLRADITVAQEAVYKTVAATEKPVAKNKAVVYIPSYVATTQAETGTESYSYMSLYEKAEEVKAYAEKNGYDTEYAFLVNLGMKSGKKRFFVIDLTSMTIVKCGLVAHGRGGSRFTFSKSYSNRPGSNCSSLGMFKVGKFYNGGFGPSYKLTGLENTNSRAYDRLIVLHAMNCIPYEESEYPVCQSEGCPSLSPQFFKEIRPLIDERERPMLLYAYDPATESE